MSLLGALKAIEHGGALRRLMATVEYVVLTADGHRKYGTLYLVISNVEDMNARVYDELVPTFEYILDGASDR